MRDVPSTTVSLNHKKLVAQAMGIPGLLTRDECAFLLTSSMDTRRHGVWLEIGAWQGRSTFLLATAARARGCELISIDTFSKPEGVKYEPSSPELVLANLRRYGVLFDGLHVGDSAAVANTVDGEIDFLFVDGDHRAAPLRADLSVWTPRLRSGGSIAFHDYGHLRWPDVALVVDEWAKANAMRVALVDQVGDLVRYRWS